MASQKCHKWLSRLIGPTKRCWFVLHQSWVPSCDSTCIEQNKDLWCKQSQEKTYFWCVININNKKLKGYNYKIIKIRMLKIYLCWQPQRLHIWTRHEEESVSLCKNQRHYHIHQRYESKRWIYVSDQSRWVSKTFQY